MSYEIETTVEKRLDGHSDFYHYVTVYIPYVAGFEEGDKVRVVIKKVTDETVKLIQGGE